MNRITDKFKTLKGKNETALIGFLTAGNPDMDRSLKIAAAICDAGIDVLELGVPFSEPMSDGPVIQRSFQRSLENGVTLKNVLTMTAALREKTGVPIILFSYYNPILAYGNETFCKDAVSAGADGLLVVDLPPEESDEMTSQWGGAAFDLIRMIATTTPVERMQRIANGASGFLYLASMTNTGEPDMAAVRAHADKLRSMTELPICADVGVSTAEDVKAAASAADGVVIGSAFEQMIEENPDHADLAGLMAGQVRAYKAAMQ